MKVTAIVLIFLVLEAFCHLFLVENLREEFLQLHSVISKNEALQTDTLSLLKEYKPYLDRFKMKEKAITTHDFFKNTTSHLRGRIAELRRLFNAFVNLVDTASDERRVIAQSAVNSFKNGNFAELLTIIQNATSNKIFFESVLEVTDTEMLEKYSILQMSFFVYQQLTMIDIKGLVLSSFATVAKNATSRILNITDYKKVLLSVSDLPDGMWKRDPPQHIKGKTYLEIEKFLQGVVAYQKNLDRKGTCSVKCGDFETVTTAVNRCDSEQSCTNAFYTYRGGELYNCKELAASLTTCRDDDHPRIYKYLKFENRIYGKEESCKPNKLKTFTKQKSCFHCVCNMYWKGSSDKAVSMRAVYSNISANKIIIGARFQKKNGIIHIQVKEARLGPFLTIADPKWVPIENFRKTDRMISLNQDYYEPTRLERAIRLADYRPHGNKDFYKKLVLTGVRFFKWQDFLSLQIRLTKFDLETGLLANQNGSSWYDIPDTPSEEIGLYNPNVPTRSKLQSDIVSKNNRQYLQFTHTSFESDFAQTTVPFFDAQEVASSGPLQGLGIYYKKHKDSGSGNFGGFIGIKLLTYDFRDYLRTGNN